MLGMIAVHRMSGSFPLALAPERDLSANTALVPFTFAVLLLGERPDRAEFRSLRRDRRRIVAGGWSRPSFRNKSVAVLVLFMGLVAVSPPSSSYSYGCSANTDRLAGRAESSRALRLLGTFVSHQGRTLQWVATQVLLSLPFGRIRALQRRFWLFTRGLRSVSPQEAPSLR